MKGTIWWSILMTFTLTPIVHSFCSHYKLGSDLPNSRSILDCIGLCLTLHFENRIYGYGHVERILI
jgi:hypothetical protein